MELTLVPIGKSFANEEGFGIVLEPKYRAGLQGLEGYSHIQVIWWFTQCDNAQSRGQLIENQPYKHGPERMGSFATRSPQRPNPLAITTAAVCKLDAENGIIHLAWLDAFDGTPILDIKPYTPSVDRVETPTVPAWCSHWPQSVETSGDFPWEDEFNF